MSVEIPAALNVATYFLDRHVAAGRGGRIAVRGEPRAYTYEELSELTSRVGNALLELGLASDERVLIVLRDSVEFIAAFFGTIKAGGIAVPVNPLARGGDYRYYLSDCGARFAVVDSVALPEFLPACASLELERLLVVGEQTSAGLSFWQLVTAAPPRLKPAPTRAADAAFFLYTSGSGGEPKAAVHAHKDMLYTAASFASRVLDIGPEDVTYSASRLFFAYGLGNALSFPFSVGASTVLVAERSSPELLWAAIGRHRPTIFYAVPTLYGGMLQVGQRPAMNTIRRAVSAGEALPAGIFHRFREETGVEILDGIGSTEMLHMFISNRPGDVRPGTCGREVEGYEAKVVDDLGEPLADNQLGNLWVRGSSAFREYWGKPELTAGTKRGDWVVTGDKFFRDPDGYYHYCGRSDDLLKVAGMWVAPTEVEAALVAHEAVLEAAVVSSRDDLGLERPRAHVVLKPGREASAELARELQEHVRGLLPGYKAPAWVLFVTELPKTATGKIQRFKLRQESR